MSKIFKINSCKDCYDLGIFECNELYNKLKLQSYWEGEIHPDCPLHDYPVERVCEWHIRGIMGYPSCQPGRETRYYGSFKGQKYCWHCGGKIVVKER